MEWEKINFQKKKIEFVKIYENDYLQNNLKTNPISTPNTNYQDIKQSKIDNILKILIITKCKKTYLNHTEFIKKNSYYYDFQQIYY